MKDKLIQMLEKFGYKYQQQDDIIMIKCMLIYV